MTDLTTTVPTPNNPSVNVAMGTFQDSAASGQARGLNNIASALSSFGTTANRAAAKNIPNIDSRLFAALSNVENLDAVPESELRGVLRDAASIEAASSQGSKDLSARRQAIVQKWIARNSDNPLAMEVISNTFQEVTGKKVGQAQREFQESIEAAELKELEDHREPCSRGEGSHS